MSLDFIMLCYQVIVMRTNLSGFVFNVSKPVIDGNFFVFVLVAEIFDVEPEIGESFFIEKESKTTKKKYF